MKESKDPKILLKFTDPLFLGSFQNFILCGDLDLGWVIGLYVLLLIMDNINRPANTHINLRVLII